MQIRIRSTGQVLLQHEWEKWVAQTYAKSLSGISEEAVNRFESDIVFEGPQATGGTVYQYSQQDGVEQIDGKWYTKYILGPVFTGDTAAADEAAYKAMKDAEQAANVRRQRTEMLKDCDWVVTKAIDQNAQDSLGIQIPVVWVTYRQALRDITAQSGFPWTITWPTQP